MHESSDEFEKTFIDTLPSKKAIWDGMGIDPWQLRDIKNFIEDRWFTRVVEFGSGASTEFILRLAKKNNVKIDSFDNSEKYAFKCPENLSKFLNLYVVKTVQYNEKQYENILDKNVITSKKRLILSQGIPVDELVVENKFDIKNAFYDISKGQLNGIYDLVILDGPNGNGRNIAFAYLKEHVHPGTVIFIDDYWHYDFIENCKTILDAEVISIVVKKHCHENHGYAILKCK